VKSFFFYKTLQLTEETNFEKQPILSGAGYKVGTALFSIINKTTNNEFKS